MKWPWDVLADAIRRETENCLTAWINSAGHDRDAMRKLAGAVADLKPTDPPRIDASDQVIGCKCGSNLPARPVCRLYNSVSRNGIKVRVESGDEFVCPGCGEFYSVSYLAGRFDAKWQRPNAQAHETHPGSMDDGKLKHPPGAAASLPMMPRPRP